jgi:hypothetical protein
MSIINEAIKKARSESRLKQTAVNDDKTMPVVPSIEPSETKWTLIVVLSLVFSISLLGSIFLYSHISQSKITYKPVVQRPEASKQILTHPVIQASSLAVTKMEETLELNGIVYGQDDKWAIINNKIVREGDRLLDGKVSLIKKDFVKISRNNGEEVILNLK